MERLSKEALELLNGGAFDSDTVRDRQIEERLKEQVSLFDMKTKKTIFTLSQEEADQVKEFVISIRGGWGWNPDQLKDAFVDRFVQGLVAKEPMEETPNVPVNTPSPWPVYRPVDVLAKKDERVVVARTSTMIVDSIMEEDTIPPVVPSTGGMPASLGSAGTVISTGECLSMNALNQAFACLEYHSIPVAAVVTNSLRWADMRNWGEDNCHPTPYAIAATRGIFGKTLNADIYVRNMPEEAGQDSVVWCLAMPDERYPRGLVSKVEVFAGS